MIPKKTAILEFLSVFGIEIGEVGVNPINKKLAFLQPYHQIVLQSVDIQATLKSYIRQTFAMPVFLNPGLCSGRPKSLPLLPSTRWYTGASSADDTRHDDEMRPRTLDYSPTRQGSI